MTEEIRKGATTIVCAPDPRLRQVAPLVTDWKLARDLSARLREAMDVSAEKGRPAAGLAAPQIGEAARVFVMADDPRAFVNPRVLRKSAAEEVAVEGCLSLPVEELVEVSRPIAVQVAALDERGRSRIVSLEGFAARVAQHEIDHLDGILITDRRAA